MTQDTETPHYAGFWVRLAAWAVDALLLTGFNSCILIPLLKQSHIIEAIFIRVLTLYYNVYSLPLTEVQLKYFSIGLGSLIGLILGTTISWLYDTLLESSSKQATLGKLLFGLKIVDEQGERISWWRANSRSWAKILSTIPLNTGFLMIAFTAKKQGLHDKLAGTYVVKKA